MSGYGVDELMEVGWQMFERGYSAPPRRLEYEIVTDGMHIVFADGRSALFSSWESIEDAIEHGRATLCYDARFKEDREMDENEQDGTETGLARVVASELEGGSLIKAAQAENRKWLQKEVVQRVQEMLHALKVQRDYLESTKDNIALCEKKLAAVEAGAFNISTRGQLTFTDPDLQREPVKMKECPNCGFSGTGNGRR